MKQPVRLRWNHPPKGQLRTCVGDGCNTQILKRSKACTREHFPPRAWVASGTPGTTYSLCRACNNSLGMADEILAFLNWTYGGCDDAPTSKSTSALRSYEWLSTTPIAEAEATALRLMGTKCRPFLRAVSKMFPQIPWSTTDVDGLECLRASWGFAKEDGLGGSDIWGRLETLAKANCRIRETGTTYCSETDIWRVHHCSIQGRHWISIEMELGKSLPLLVLLSTPLSEREPV